MKISTLHSLISVYNGTDNEKIYHDVARILLDNITDIPDMTINDAADLCFTSPSTISRMMKLLECGSFVEFKSDIRDALAGYPFTNRCMPYDISKSTPYPNCYLDSIVGITEDIRDNFNPSMMDRFVDTIHAANKVFFFANVVSEETRRMFQYDLIMGGKKTFFFDTEREQIQAIKQVAAGDVLVVAGSGTVQFSYVYDIMKKARAAGASVLVVSSSATPNIASYADFVIQCKTTGTAIDRYAYNIYISLITMAYRNRYLENNG